MPRCVAVAVVFFVVVANAKAQNAAQGQSAVQAQDSANRVSSLDAQTVQPPPRGITPTYSSTTGFRLNPLGLFETLALRLTLPLSQSTHPLFAGTYARAEAVLFASPATLSPGVALSIQPINMIRFGVSYTPVRYWGTFDSLQSFSSPTSEYVPSRLDDGYSYGQWVHQLNLSIMLQAKVSSFALRSETVFSYIRANFRNGDTVYLDFTWDVLAPDRGWVIQNDTDLVYMASKRVTVGIRHTLVTAIYPDSAFEDGESRDQDVVPTSRIGPIALYKLSLEKTGKIREPTLFLTVNWWLKSRYRTGQDVAQAIPYVLGGINFTGW